MFESNNEIIQKEVPKLIAAIDASMLELGIKHNRTDDPAKTKYKLRKQNGQINRISIALTKGLIMTHKGKGGRGQDKRHPKDFYNHNVDAWLPGMADQIAANTGDIICGNLAIR